MKGSRVVAGMGEALLAHAWLIFALSVAGLALRVLLVADPTLMHDEYFYAKTSQLWAAHQQDLRQITPVANRGGAGFPNALFFAIYRVAYWFGDNFYVVGKLLNVLFATLSALAIHRVGARFVEQRAAVLIAALALWLPATSYLSYFMPEALYECLVWWGLATFMSTARRDLRIASTGLGAFLGAALLAKPNAAAVLVASNLVVAIVAWRCLPRPERLGRLLQSVLAIDVAFVAAGWLLNVALTGHLRWDPIGTFYGNGLSQLTTVQTDASFVLDLARYVLVYVYALTIAFGAAAIVVLSAGLPRSRDPLTTALWAFAVVGVGTLLLGSAKVGVNWERVFANHLGAYSTRYMSVLFPLLVIGLFALLPHSIDRWRARRAWGVVFGVALIALAIVFRNIDNPTQLPEVYGIARLYGRLFKPTLAAGLLVLLYYAFARRPDPRVYAAFIAVYALASAVGLVKEDFRRSTDWQVKVHADAGRMARALVLPEHRDRGLVVTVTPAAASRFMTMFPGIVPVQLAPRDATLPRDALSGTPEWVVFLESVRPGFDAHCIDLQEATLCALRGAPLQTYAPPPNSPSR